MFELLGPRGFSDEMYSLQCRGPVKSITIGKTRNSPAQLRTWVVPENSA